MPSEIVPLCVGECVEYGTVIIVPGTTRTPLRCCPKCQGVVAILVDEPQRVLRAHETTQERRP